MSCTDKNGIECSDLQPKVCVQDLTVTISLTNIGDTPVVVTNLERFLNGENVDLLASVTVNPISPGELTSVVEVIEFDFCATDTFSYSIIGEGDPPTGSGCADSDELEFAVNSANFPSASPSESMEPSGAF